MLQRHRGSSFSGRLLGKRIRRRRYREFLCIWRERIEQFSLVTRVSGIRAVDESSSGSSHFPEVCIPKFCAPPIGPRRFLHEGPTPRRLPPILATGNVIKRDTDRAKVLPVRSGSSIKFLSRERPNCELLTAVFRIISAPLRVLQVDVHLPAKIPRVPFQVIYSPSSYRSRRVHCKTALDLYSARLARKISARDPSHG